MAAASSRCASMTGRPKQSSPSVVTSPAEIPIRTCMGPPPEGAARESASISCCTDTAAEMASDAPEKMAMTPSPVCLATRPWDATTAARTRRS